MNILVLGGARFVGRHIVEALVGAGHQVSVLTRGLTEAQLPGSVEFLIGDRNEGQAGLVALEGRSWDACVDVSGYTPRQVRASTDFLREQVGHYVFISTVSVYAEQHRHPLLEDDPLLPAASFDEAPVTFETYGPMKVTCEHLVREAFGTACTVLRPQLVAGPHDHTLRYAYWPQRVARGGTVLAAGADEHIQVIDARDMGAFVVKVVQEEMSGTFNLAGPRLMWRQFLGQLGAQDVFWTTAEELGRGGFSASDVPVYVPERGAQGGIMNVSSRLALEAGLTLSSPERTARDTLLWSTAFSSGRGENQALMFSLTPEREAEMLRVLQQSRPRR